MPTRLRPVSHLFMLTLTGRRKMTLHLLKQTAKPSKAREKRKKYAVLDFQQRAEQAPDEVMKEDNAEGVTDPSFKDVTDTLRKSKRNKTVLDQA